jgi:hypothetical protein
MYTLRQQLRSWRHGFWFGISERVRWSRGIHRETPARELPALSREQIERIAALRARYQVRFEATLNGSTSLNNYEYLDILDRAWTAGPASTMPRDTWPGCRMPGSWWLIMPVSASRPT